MVSITNAHNKEIQYKFIETKAEYKGHSCKLAVLYSYSLEEKKRNSCIKNVEKEKEKIEKVLQKYEKRSFKCLPDAKEEIELLEKSLASKSKHHKISIYIYEHKKRR